MGWPKGNTRAKEAWQKFSGRFPSEDRLEVIAESRFGAGNDAADGTKKRPSGCPGIVRDNGTVIGVVNDLPTRQVTHFHSVVFFRQERPICDPFGA
jgi:hypothetical protein